MSPRVGVVVVLCACMATAACAGKSDLPPPLQESPCGNRACDAGRDTATDGGKSRGGEIDGAADASAGTGGTGGAGGTGGTGGTAGTGGTGGTGGASDGGVSFPCDAQIFRKLAKNRVSPDRSVLAIGARLSFEGERLFEIKRDYGIARKLQQEITKRANRDRVRDLSLSSC